jgi:protein-disulfide isomerase
MGAFSHFDGGIARMTKFTRIAAGLLFGAALSASAYAAQFNNEQKAEMGEIIKNYLMEHPEVIREALRELEKRQAQEEAAAQTAAIAENASEIFRNKGDLVAGNPEGKVTLVEFFDYNCGYCKRAFPDVLKMIESDPDLRVVLKEFPILGSGSVYASQAALASRKQNKYWEFHLALISREGHVDEAAVDEVAKSVGLDVEKLKQDMKAQEVQDTLAANMKLSEALRLQGTPAFIVDQTFIPGAIGFDGLMAAVKKVRDSGGCQVC